MLFWRDPSRWRATPYQRADHGLASSALARKCDRRANRGARKSLNLNPGGPSRSRSIAPAETINLNPGGPSRLRRARFFGTHAPRDKENQPENAGVRARPSPRCCFGATPLVGELPRTNGQTTAWPAAPSRVSVIEEQIAGPGNH